MDFITWQNADDFEHASLLSTTDYFQPAKSKKQKEIKSKTQFPLLIFHVTMTQTYNSVPGLSELLEWINLAWRFSQTLDINFLLSLFFDQCATLNNQKTNLKRKTFSLACARPLKLVFKVIGNYLNETLNIFIKT